MVREKLKTPEGRKFLLALLVVFMIAAPTIHVYYVSLSRIVLTKRNDSEKRT